VAEDVLRDFFVVLETADGTMRSYKPEAFRLAARGINKHARLVPVRKR